SAHSHYLPSFLFAFPYFSSIDKTKYSAGVWDSFLTDGRAPAHLLDPGVRYVLKKKFCGVGKS
ncbi:MAG TPA: hypothetical protein VFJ52_14200, partial [Terriglobia bacterium]|nr:hypothetical protein [Terriglobia bacterium]